jgi:hypothetical protein
MVEPYLMHFVVRKVTFTTTATGYIVTSYTNYPVHLWKRETTTVPQKHINPVIVRGAPVGTFIDQCFVVFTDIEQQEPGDTTTHTFIQEPWPACQTRWFYFWGTVGGVLSPSASAIFSQRRIEPIRLYSDKSTGLTTVDGDVQRTGSALTWANVHDGPGVLAMPGGGYMAAGIASDFAANKWQGISRMIMTFSLAQIPPGTTIMSATFSGFVGSKMDTFGYNPEYALVQSNPTHDNNLVLADYQRLYAVPMSNALSHNAITVLAFNHWTLNTAGLAALVPGQIARLGMREMKYEAPNIEPPWMSSRQMLLYVYQVDYITTSYHPYLEIIYQCPPL